MPEHKSVNDAELLSCLSAAHTAHTVEQELLPRLNACVQGDTAFACRP